MKVLTGERSPCNADLQALYHGILVPFYTKMHDRVSQFATSFASVLAIVVLQQYSSQPASM